MLRGFGFRFRGLGFRDCMVLNVEHRVACSMKLRVCKEGTMRSNIQAPTLP